MGGMGLHMDIKNLNSQLKQKKILSVDKLSTLEKDFNSQKATTSWEDFLLQQKAVTEDQILTIKSEELGVPVVDLKDLKIDQAVLSLVPEPIANRHKIISFAKTNDSLHLAMIDPTDIQSREFIQKKTGLKIVPFLIGKTSFEAGVTKYHSNLEGEIQNLVSEDAPGLTTSAPGEVDDSLKKMAQEIPVIRVVDTLLEYAIFEKASDIHIEPQENSVIVRYRIDGILHDVMTLPKVIHAALVARLKVLSNLKIDEHRLPQDGRFKIQKEGYKFAFRVSTIPVFDGEKVVMRLLDESAKALTLEQLGFEKSMLDVVIRNIKKPHGALLVTGPTGSGKSTTLYAIITLLNTRHVNISTIEDPVEYRIEGANQMQVNPKIGLTFAIGLRALLRQDPNIIMIGEVRDKETAEEAVHAAMTGHIVLSTLHTNTSAGALPRLVDIGVEPFLIASTVNAVIAQRLVRILCGACKKQTKITKDAVQELSSQFKIDRLMAVLLKEKYLNAKQELQDLPFWQAVGCEKCNHTGYRGRIGIHEVLEVTPKIAELMISKASSGDLQDQAEAEGMILMWQDGFIKSIQGVTTIDEVLRVSKE